MRDFFKNNEKGAIIVLTAFLVPLMIICLGLAIDFGNLYAHKTRLQNAADAAALAGARAFAVSSEEQTPDTYEYHPHADAEAELYTEENAERHNLNNDVNFIPSAGQSSDEKTIYYKVELNEQVPLYFMRILGDNFKETQVDAVSIAAISASEGYEYENGRDLFLFKHNFDAVNSINNPDTDKKGQISNFFDGNIAFTDGSGQNEDNASKYKYTSLRYSSQKDDLAYFFTSKVKEEDLSINEAKEKGLDYAFPSIFEDYDMQDLAKRARAELELPEYVEDTGWPQWDESKYSSWDEYTAVTDAYSKAQSDYKSHFKLTTDDNGYYKNLTSAKLSDDIAISANNGDGNVNATIDSAIPGSSDDPVYLYLDPTIYFFGLDVNVSNGRPLILIYTGTGSVHINVASGATFSGVYYAPNSEDVLINAGGATFEGTIIAGSMSLRGDDSTYRYKDFIDGQSAKHKVGNDGKASKGSTVNLVNLNKVNNVEWH